MCVCVCVWGGGGIGYSNTHVQRTNVQIKAVLVVDHDVLYGLQGSDDDHLDFTEELVDGLHPVYRNEVQLQIFEHPFTPKVLDKTEDRQRDRGSGV
jgi:hypothetical protein